MCCRVHVQVCENMCVTSLCLCVCNGVYACMRMGLCVQVLVQLGDDLYVQSFTKPLRRSWLQRIIHTIGG